jgi:hypothetical protein
MKKKNIKIVNYLAIISLWLNQMLYPALVWAEEILDTPTPIPTDVVTEMETPRPTEAIVGVLETPTPEVTSQPEIIINKNESVVATESSASGQTGGNEVEEAKLGEIESGNAAAIVDNSNNINGNVVLVTPSMVASPSGVVDPAGVEGEGVIIVIPKQVVNINQAEVNNQSQSAADSGNNAISDAKSGDINSGDSVAMANVINSINTNIVGSQVEVYVANKLVGNLSTLDLNDLWQKTQKSGTGESIPGLTTVDNFNQAVVNNYVEVVANSGFNQIGETDEAMIFTGNATALANVINLINMNIVGSRLFFGVVNIEGSLLGDIILPNPDFFGQNNPDESMGIKTENDNLVVVSNLVESKATSGGNQIVADNKASIESGEAMAISNSNTILNMDLIGSNSLFLTINNLGTALGQVYNWSAPGSIETLAPGLNNFFIPGWQYLGSNQGTAYAVYNLNLAEVDNSVKVLASTGGNEIDQCENGLIKTGKALAVANVNNFINLNLTGNNWFYGLINIVGDWRGRAIFAYPDLTIGLSSDQNKISEGELVEYRVVYENSGYDESQEVEITLNLPENFEYVSDNSGQETTRGNNWVKWSLGKLPAFKGGTFKVIAATNREKEQAWSLVKKAIASENEIEVSTQAVIRTNRAEVNLNNNSAIVKTTIVMFDHDTGLSETSSETEMTKEGMGKTNSSGGVDPRQPKLEIGAKNNVNDFVYPADVVTFEISVKNLADVSAHDTYLVHETFDGDGNLYRHDEITIGEIKAFRKGSVRFGVPMTRKETKGGRYETRTKIFGVAINGNRVESNEATTNYLVKETKMVSIQAGAIEDIAEVQGVSDDKPEVKNKWWPYLMMVGSTSLLYGQTDKWVKQRKNKYSLAEIVFYLLTLGCFGYSMISILRINRMLFSQTISLMSAW